MSILMRRTEHSVQVLASKTAFWEEYEEKLGAHAENLAMTCSSIESVSNKADRFSFPTEMRRKVAGNIQRIAKLITAKADHEVLQKISSLTQFTESNVDWDGRILGLRQMFLREFMTGARARIDRKAPVAESSFAAQTRDKYYCRVQQLLDLAMTKHSRVEVGVTLFGKHKLDPVCIACDRPTGAVESVSPRKAKGAGAGSGSGSAKGLYKGSNADEAVSPQHQQQQQQQQRLPWGAGDGIIRPQTADGGSSHQGRYVYRGGFRIPLGQDTRLASASGPVPSLLQTSSLPNLDAPHI
ncbi:unnamed protein product [Chrysoparadoxa australica]